MILCKDQASYDALMALCDEFPESLDKVKGEARIIAPQELLDFLDPNHSSDRPVMLVDENVVANLRQHEIAHQMMREEIKRTGREPVNHEIRLQFTNSPDNVSWSDRLTKVLRRGLHMPPDVYANIQRYLTSKMDDQHRVIITEEILLEVERLAKVHEEPKRVAIVGGIGLIGKGLGRSLTESLGNIAVSTPTDRYPLEFYAAPHREGHEVSKKGRRDVVVSKKGNSYPLPKGLRGMPRVGRTRGR